MDSTGFFRQVADRLGVHPTQQVLNFLNSWAGREGVPQGVDPYNLLGTTLPVGGSHGTNAPGVQAYPSLSAGVEATARMLSQGNFRSILGALRSGNPAAYSRDPAVNREMLSWSGGGYSWPSSGGGPVGLPSGSASTSSSGGSAAQPAKAAGSQPSNLFQLLDALSPMSHSYVDPFVYRPGGQGGPLPTPVAHPTGSLADPFRGFLAALSSSHSGLAG